MVKVIHAGPKSLLNNVISGGMIRVARAVLQIFITPIIIALLGPEQYGLVAFSLTVQMIFFVLDQALSPAVIRELGKEGANPNPEKLWTVLLTFEKCSIIMGVLIAGIVIGFAPWIAEHWLQSPSISPDKITYAIRLIGVLLACLWPSLIYGSFYIGLQRQNSLALITVVISTAQALTSVSVLYLWKDDVLVLFGIQILFSAVLTLVMRLQLARLMPEKPPVSHFNLALLNTIKRFAGGTFIIAITSAILTQADKVLVAKLVPLEEFSAYALSFSVLAQAAMILASPLMIAIQPVMANVMNNHDEKGKAEQYHTYSQINALLAFTAFGTAAFYAEPLLTLWLGEASELVPQMSVLVPWIAAGTILNILNSMPYIAQMATGWVTMKVILNVILSIAFLAALIILVPVYGLIIGPYLWIALNAVSTFIEAPLMHRKYLKGEYFSWLTKDILWPGSVALIVFWAMAYFVPVFESAFLNVGKAVLNAGIVGGILLFCLPKARQTILTSVYKKYEQLVK